MTKAPSLRFINRVRESADPDIGLDKLAHLGGGGIAALDGFRLHAVHNFTYADVLGEEDAYSDKQKKRCTDCINRVRAQGVIHRCKFNAALLVQSLRDFGNTPVTLTFRENVVEIQGVLDDYYETDAYALVMAMYEQGPSDPPWAPLAEEL